VRKNPNAVRALMSALVRGQKYAADPANRAEVLDLVARETKQDRALVETIWGQYVFNPAFDEAYVADMRNMADYLVASGRLKSVTDPMDYSYTAPVAAVDPGLVKIQGKAKI
jgi:ABC-type nitrate/sulfonate/bicarbonate transport system substrate-binding protein